MAEWKQLGFCNITTRLGVNLRSYYDVVFGIITVILLVVASFIFFFFVPSFNKVRYRNNTSCH